MFGGGWPEWPIGGGPTGGPGGGWFKIGGGWAGMCAGA